MSLLVAVGRVGLRWLWGGWGCGAGGAALAARRKPVRFVGVVSRVLTCGSEGISVARVTWESQLASLTQVALLYFFRRVPEPRAGLCKS
jgi:hypothetical protein